MTKQTFFRKRAKAKQDQGVPDRESEKHFAALYMRSFTEMRARSARS